MATHSSVLAWKIPRTEEPGGLPSMGSHRVRHHWSDLAAAFKLSMFSFFKFLIFFCVVLSYYLYFTNHFLASSNCTYINVFCILLFVVYSLQNTSFILIIGFAAFHEFWYAIFYYIFIQNIFTFYWFCIDISFLQMSSPLPPRVVFYKRHMVLASIWDGFHTCASSHER